MCVCVCVCVCARARGRKSLPGRVCVFGVGALACMHEHDQQGHIAVVSLRQSSHEQMGMAWATT